MKEVKQQGFYTDTFDISNSFLILFLLFQEQIFIFNKYLRKAFVFFAIKQSKIRRVVKIRQQQTCLPQPINSVYITNSVTRWVVMVLMII